MGSSPMLKKHMGTQPPLPVVVKSLREEGNTEGRPQNIFFTLQTTGSLLADSLTVKVAKFAGGGYQEIPDCKILRNVTLSGTQSFELASNLKAGRYSYWVSFKKPGSLWTDLPFLPSQSFIINK
jgi:hypothetical protein